VTFPISSPSKPLEMTDVYGACIVAAMGFCGIGNSMKSGYPRVAPPVPSGSSEKAARAGSPAPVPIKF
jgi:hypothetical protein